MKNKKNNLHKCFICNEFKNYTDFYFINDKICITCTLKDYEYLKSKRMEQLGKVYNPKINETIQDKPKIQPIKKYKHSLSKRVKERYNKKLHIVLQKNHSSNEFIPFLNCSVKHFIDFIESQFTEGMSWENYGYHGWHIDHYVPYSFFNCKDLSDMKLCWNYQNLRPLWEKDNLDKCTKVPEDYMDKLIIIRKSLRKNNTPL